MPKSAVRYDFRRALLDTCINEFESCFMRENEQISRYQMKTDEKHKNATFFSNKYRMAILSQIYTE